MKQNKIAIFQLVIGMLLATIPFAGVYAAVPMEINYQGTVTRSDGTAFDGTGYFKFSLLNAAGDSAYWSNDGNTTNGNEPASAVNVPVSNGKFAVKLGSSDYPNMNALSLSIFANNDVKLRVWFSETGNVGSFEQFQQDTNLISSAYAIKADTADKIGSLSEAQIQQRVTGNCQTGYTVIAIAADGGVSCAADQVGITTETDPTITDPSIKDGVSWTEISAIPAGFADGVDNDTTYSAGSGIGLSGNTFSASNIANANIAANAAIAASKINRIGLNADTLDGIDSTGYSKSTHTHTGSSLTYSVTEFSAQATQTSPVGGASSQYRIATTTTPTTRPLCMLRSAAFAGAGNGTTKACDVRRETSGQWTVEATTVNTTGYATTCRMYCL